MFASPSFAPKGASSSLFWPPAFDSGGYEASSVAVADLNGDGKPDLVVANYCGSGEDGSNCSGTIAVLLGNGNGTFRTPVAYDSGGQYAFFVTIADVNGDGKPDLVVANDYTAAIGTGSVGVLLGNGDGTFQAAISYGTGGRTAESLAVADLNGDGKPDVLVANYCAADNCAGGVVAVLMGNGDGTFGTPVNYDAGGYQAYSVAVGDVNGDGKPDVIVANVCNINIECEEGGVVGVLLGNGDGTLRPVVAYASGGIDAFSVVLADLNGDGRLDIAVANDTGSSGGGGAVGVLLGNGDGTFRAPVSYGSGGIQAISVAAADVNGDGKPDLVVANLSITCTKCTSGAVGVLLGNGDGSFQAAMTYGSGGYQGVSIAVADVNGDRRPDLLVANQCAGSTSTSCAIGTDGNVGVLIGNGHGSFSAPFSYSSGGYGGDSVVAADINGDGKADLVVANYCSSGNSCATGSVSVLLSKGNGTLRPTFSHGSGGYGADSVAVADINGDGKPDLLVANSCAIGGNCANGVVGVLLGNGDGTFRGPASYGSGGFAANFVGVADVNGDGKPDLLVANSCGIGGSCANGIVGVLLGNGNGTFRPAVSYPSGGYQANSVAVADVNGDGKPDLLVVSVCAGNTPCESTTNDGVVAVLLGNGDGTFQVPVSYDSGGYQANSVAVGDVNGDGRPDLLVTNNCTSSTNCTNGAVGVLLGNGDGTFQPAATFATPPLTELSSTSLVLADLNGDGKLDAASANGSFVLLGNGNGTFTLSALGSSGESITVGDFNGDGRMDLALGGGSYVSVLLNISPFHFASDPR